MMLCDICGKRAATVHLTEIIDGNIQELHLCEDCALKKSQEMQKSFSLGDMLASLVETVSSEEESLICPRCGLTYSEFRKTGRLGCSNCYSAFKRQLTQLIKTVQGSNLHTGKVPVGVPSLKIDFQIEDLKRKLKRAVELEEFEEAAKLRDKIHELEKKKRKT